jgi:Na+/proline symporter
VNALFMLLILLPAVAGGFFWCRATAKASLWSIVVGLAVMMLVLPFAPNTAFVPGFMGSALVFVVMSFWTSHEACERINIWSPQSADSAGADGVE